MTDIIRWDPFNDLVSIQDELHRLFGRTFTEAWPTHRSARGSWMPALDVFETEDRVVAKMDLPGIDPDDVEVSMEDSTLTVSGTRELSSEVEEDDYHRIERRFGSFTRSIVLPQTADAEKVEATFDKGVLTIEVGKTQKTKPTRIQVKTSA